MFADVTQRFGCLDCGYFTNVKCNIERHVQTSGHKEKILSKSHNSDRKYQCLSCSKIYKSQSGLWSHKKKCISKKAVEVKDEKPLIEQMMEMKKMMEEMMKNQQPTINNTTNNYNIFLNEKCGNAVNMLDFVKGIKFCIENFELENLLVANALDHTVSIFEKHLNKMAINERPMHSFRGEDPHQLIAHYRHNNEWKMQTEMKMLDESHRDFDGNDPVDTFMYYLAMFHTRRRDCFERMYGKKHRLSPNLNHTTNSSEQYDLSRRLLEMVAINPTEKELKE
jgi:hypothetical protein